MNNYHILHGHPLVELDSVDSTNNYAANLLRDGNPADGTVILSHFQTGGRGQRGAIWQSQPGENLTFSVIKYVPFLKPSELFWLTQITALAIHSVVDIHVPKQTMVKWPNDILVDGIKIAGILIENGLAGSKLTHCIIGIGLNINQFNFDGLDATSLFRESGSKFDIRNVLSDILAHFDRYFHLLRNGRYQQIREEYLNHLYLRDISAQFQSRGNQFEGIIKDVSPEGNLVVNTSVGLREFALKEIEFLG